MIQNSGVKIGGEIAANPNDEIAVNGEIVVQVGKRKFYRVILF
jgi:tyrosyl-tRNA synthetase